MFSMVANKLFDKACLSSVVQRHRSTLEKRQCNYAIAGTVGAGL